VLDCHAFLTNVHHSAADATATGDTDSAGASTVSPSRSTASTAAAETSSKKSSIIGPIVGGVVGGLVVLVIIISLVVALLQRRRSRNNIPEPYLFESGMAAKTAPQTEEIHELPPSDLETKKYGDSIVSKVPGSDEVHELGGSEPPPKVS
jgi:hypothetical protein